MGIHSAARQNPSSGASRLRAMRWSKRGTDASKSRSNTAKQDCNVLIKLYTAQEAAMAELRQNSVKNSVFYDICRCAMSCGVVVVIGMKTKYNKTKDESNMANVCD